MRYIVLVLCNLPLILMAFVAILTQYKMNKVSKERFWRQIALWALVLIVLVGSFPMYNYLNGKPLLDSDELSLFDIVQTTALVFLFYVVNYQRQHIENTERTVRDLHQELSIKFSEGQDDPKLK